MEETESAMMLCESSLLNYDDGPPALSIDIPKISDINAVSKLWKDVPLPIDILILTVGNDQFLCCYFYLRDVFKSLKKELGFVYFGDIGEGEGAKLKIALLRCSEGAGEPSGALTLVPKAVAMLQPRAVFCAGSCAGLHRDKTNLGDVVISTKLTTYAQRKVTSNGVESLGFSVPVSPSFGLLVKDAGFGWKAPLLNPEVAQVEVHSNCEFLSGPEHIESSQRRNELVSLYPNAIAVEGDGEGIFVAAHDLKTEWVVIKGISRYADTSAQSTEHWSQFSCAMAASVVNKILSEPSVFEDWPHYQSDNINNSNNNSNTTTQSEGPEHSRPLPLVRPGNAGDLFGSLVQTFAGDCDNGQETYKGRTIYYNARGRIHSFAEPWVYDASARDLQSGISAEARHYYTSQEAIQHALQKLKDRLRSERLLME